MPALQGAVALEEMQDVAVAIAEELHFDVSRPVEVLLQIDAAVLEGRFGLGPRGGDAGNERGRVAGDAHAFPAAAGRRLDEHRVADFLGKADALPGRW